MTTQTEVAAPIVDISGKNFLIGCFFISIGLWILNHWVPFGAGIIAAEVFLTIICLFIFGSIRYRLDKNALTYGAVLIVMGTFFNGWWQTSHLRESMAAEGISSLLYFVRHQFFTLHGLDQLFHADTMLFILGLTFFVCVIAQTRLLETASFKVLEKLNGRIVPTISILIGIVAFASGILDGVSMIGLMIRTLVIILFLAKAKDEAVLYSVIVSTVVTTVCGMWLAYGEPPNLIMKANLHPLLDNIFFLKYCLPVAFASYVVVIWNVKRKLRGQRIEMEKLDILDRFTADVRFLQATRHGEVLTPIEFIEEHRELFSSQFEEIIKRLHLGEPLGSALVGCQVPPAARQEILGKYVTEEVAQVLDQHYVDLVEGKEGIASHTLKKIEDLLVVVRKQRIRSQRIGCISFIPFIGFLIYHGINHEAPLFVASFAGFFVALFGILGIPKMRKLALTEAKQEYSEYLFLFPLFLSITLLQKAGFFDEIAQLLHRGIESFGVSHIAYAQFLGATFLSAILDNNVVADFASRGLHGLELGVLYLFSMAQIAGYAIGGCWTHIGCAQSVVAYSFIHKEVDEHYTPFQWIKAMTPTILELIALATVFIYGLGFISRILFGK